VTLRIGARDSADQRGFRVRPSSQPGLNDVSETLVTLVRHGETEWSRLGQHTGRTDLDLTDVGEAQARQVGAALTGARFDVVVCSPRRRAQRTAALAGLVPFTTDDDLAEWDYGELEGLTTAEIQVRDPGWSIWQGPWPGGETAVDVTARADRLIDRVLRREARRVALVGHGHFSRVLAARWLGQSVAAGRWLDLDTATWSELGWSRGDRVLRHWNVPPSFAPAALP
jgi:broad specificity phosphatase PhoE